MAPAEALAIAQARLDALRAAHRAARTPEQPVEERFGLPAHLGWGAERLVRLAPRPSLAAPPTPALLPPPTAAPTTADAAQEADPLPATLAVLPDVALAMLRSDRTAVGRLWWLLRALDRDGRGMVALPTARDRFSAAASPWRICGRRQLRHLLQQGDGLFWQRDGERIWLRSAARVAAGLGVLRAQLPAVLLPVQRLLGPLGQVRAALYATLHQSRPSTPIARATLQQISGVSPSSQRAYETAVGIRARAQYALHAGPAAELAWRHGRAVFPFIDRRGRHGPAGRAWTARQLPNCYETDRQPRRCRRKRALNRRLAVLSHSGTTGNNQADGRAQRYCSGGKQAAHNGEGALYPAVRPNFWYVLESRP